jgi:hypothetical protein
MVLDASRQSIFAVQQAAQFVCTAPMRCGVKPWRQCLEAGRKNRQ